MGAYANRRKFVTDLRGRPQIDNKDCTGGDDIRLRGNNSLGLPGFHGCGYAAVYEEQVIIPADRIRTHTQTEHIYDIYYNRMFFLCAAYHFAGYIFFFHRIVFFAAGYGLLSVRLPADSNNPVNPVNPV